VNRPSISMPWLKATTRRPKTCRTEARGFEESHNKPQWYRNGFAETMAIASGDGLKLSYSYHKIWYWASICQLFWVFPRIPGFDPSGNPPLRAPLRWSKGQYRQRFEAEWQGVLRWKTGGNWILVSCKLEVSLISVVDIDLLRPKVEQGSLNKAVTFVCFFFRRTWYSTVWSCLILLRWRLYWRLFIPVTLPLPPKPLGLHLLSNQSQYSGLSFVPTGWAFTDTIHADCVYKLYYTAYTVYIYIIYISFIYMYIYIYILYIYMEIILFSPACDRCYHNTVCIVGASLHKWSMDPLGYIPV
jgi:hypothetical protein